MVVRKILKFFSPRPIKFSTSAKGCGTENFEIFFLRLTKISASGNHDGAEHFEKFFLQGQANFPPQPSVVVRKILNFFFSMPTKFSTSANYGGVEHCHFFFFMANQNFHLSQVWWCRKLMILYCTSHKIVLHQTSVLVWDD